MIHFPLDMKYGYVSNSKAFELFDLYGNFELYELFGLYELYKDMNYTNHMKAMNYEFCTNV